MPVRPLLAALALAALASAGPAGPATDPPPAKAKADAPDLSRFPVVTGKVAQVVGHSMGYVDPRPGEPFRLDPTARPHPLLTFDPARRSYIAFPSHHPDGLAPRAVRFGFTGGLASVRLVAESPRGGDRVTVDVVPNFPGSRRVRVWAVCEYENTVTGTFALDGEAAGPFPARP